MLGRSGHQRLRPQEVPLPLGLRPAAYPSTAPKPAPITVINTALAPPMRTINCRRSSASTVMVSPVSLRRSLSCRRYAPGRCRSSWRPMPQAANARMTQMILHRDRRGRRQIDLRGNQHHDGAEYQTQDQAGHQVARGSLAAVHQRNRRAATATDAQSNKGAQAHELLGGLGGGGRFAHIEGDDDLHHRVDAEGQQRTGQLTRDKVEYIKGNEMAIQRA